MIKSLTVTNYIGESIYIELGNPDPTGLIVANIDGLGPAEASINTTELATGDGGVFSSSRLGTRNIVISFIFQESPTIEEVRQKTYKYFPIKRKVTVRVETDTRTVETDGYVESNSPVIFSEQEYTQISIVCPNPYFYDVGDSYMAFMGATPLFEFPFENPVGSAEIEFSEIVYDKRAILTYSGDIETGVVMTIHAMDTVSGITLYNVNTRESMKIDTERIRKLTGTAFGSADDIVISTIPGDKYCKLLRNGQYTNIISALNKDADWFTLVHGDNVFAFTADVGETKMTITFSYRNAYGGV